MPAPEPFVADLTSFWYTQRASTLVLLCQACQWESNSVTEKKNCGGNEDS
jgi:hypothetical protein